MLMAHLVPALLITTSTQAAEIPAGPTPQIPNEAEAVGPGPFPNTSVTAVSYQVDASNIT